MTKALVKYQGSLIRRADGSVTRVPPLHGLPPGDGDIERATRTMLRMSKVDSERNDAVVIELETETDLSAGEWLEGKKYGKVETRRGAWVFIFDETSQTGGL